MLIFHCGRVKCSKDQSWAVIDFFKIRWNPSLVPSPQRRKGLLPSLQQCIKSVRSRAVLATEKALVAKRDIGHYYILLLFCLLLFQFFCCKDQFAVAFASHHNALNREKRALIEAWRIFSDILGILVHQQRLKRKQTLRSLDYLRTHTTKDES